MFDHPPLPSVILLPQYSQVIIISPNLGAIGAAQLGHFREVAVDGAMTGVDVAGIPGETVLDELAWPVLLPQCEQNNASSAS